MNKKKEVEIVEIPQHLGEALQAIMTVMQDRARALNDCREVSLEEVTLAHGFYMDHFDRKRPIESFAACCGLLMGMLAVNLAEARDFITAKPDPNQKPV